MEPEAPVRMRKRAIRPEPYKESKRSTINLGIEDFPASSPPESVPKFRTDDDVKLLKNKWSNLRLSSFNDQEWISFFLLKENPGMRKINLCQEKENRLLERKKSLMEPHSGVAPVGRNHTSGGSAQIHTPSGDEMRRDIVNCESMKDALTSCDSVFYDDNVKRKQTNVYPNRNQETNLSLDKPNLVGVSSNYTSPFGLPKPPPRRKRDARRRAAELNLSESHTPTTPTTPISPGTSDPLNTPDMPITPGTPNTVGTVSLPSTPTTPQGHGNETFFNVKKFTYPDSPNISTTPDVDYSLSSTPDTLESPINQYSPGRLSTTSLILEEQDAVLNLKKKSHTMDNRTMRSNKKNDWEMSDRSEDVMHPRNPQDLRRSISEYQTSHLGGSSNQARRTISDPNAKKIKTKRGTSIRDRLSRLRKNEGILPYFSRKERSRSRKRSVEDLPEDEGVVARVTHGNQRSAPPSPQPPPSRSAETTSRNILEKFQRFKKGTKSSSKTSKGKTPQGTESVDVGGEDGLSRSHSHEDLYHASPLQNRSRVLPNQDETRRTKNTLKIWIMEAKNIPSKKKYFCHLIVDMQPSHRTCSKIMTDMCFWGEYFEEDLNPETTTICIELKREGDKKSHKKIGSVEIDLKPSSPGRATHEEQWYPVKVDKQDKSSPALRIRHRFQSLDILPLSQYGSLRQYLKENAISLCQLLEPVLSVKAKEDIATTLINILQAENCAISFLVDLVYTDIQTNENEHLLFRGNSVATKAIEAYMKLVGEQYLHDTLQDPIHALITNCEDLEVDPLRISNIQLIHEQRNSLKEQVTAVWEKILQSSRNFPVELREVFHKLREQLSRQEKCELTDNLISSCVFLRFFCPAVLSPSLFNMATEFPDERAARNLTLVAKTLQTLANFTLFQGKERFMEYLNEFISREQERCRTFLRAISSPPSSEDIILEYDGKIDLGKHLALLHLHLADVLTDINTQGYESEASRVMALVEDISASLGGSHNGLPLARCPTTSLPLTGSPAIAPSHMHTNNNFPRDECADGIEEAGTGVGIPSNKKSQSFPHSTTPVYSRQHMVTSSPRTQYHHQGRSAGSDLGASEEYVISTTFDQSSRPQISMFPSNRETNNNNPLAVDARVNNSNTYYMAEVHPPLLHQVHHQPQRALVHNPTQPPPHPRTTALRNVSVGGVPSPADRKYSDLFRYMDDVSHKITAEWKDAENNFQGSQTSISQLSNIASSGYQSLAYSQSSSPVDSLLHTDNSSLLSRENGNPGLPVGIRQVLQESPLASPLHQQTSKYRAVGMHPSHLGHAGHSSLHGTPRHAPRVPQAKESPNSSLSSSQSVEDLSSLRRGRTRQRRSASSSSDSSPDSHPPSHPNSHFRRALAHTPRTNPHCSPRLVPSPALRHELRSTKQRHDRSVSGRRGKSNRSCDREREDLRGAPHRCEDSEDDLNIATGSLGGAGAGGWGREGWQEQQHLAPGLGSQQVLDQQEDQMRAIIERLMSMEQEFRHEQEMLRREMHYKDARINAQEKKIAALDSANTHLIRTIASLNTRSGELKPDIAGDMHNDSCNASDTSDYKSSSC